MLGKAGIPLFEALKKIDPNVIDEHTFEWLFLPKSSEQLDKENTILQALWDDCKKRGSTKFQGKECDYRKIYYSDDKIKGRARRLEVDFYLPKYNLIIELDELQHFTEERKLTLDFYESNSFKYDINRWKDLCVSYEKKDSDPPERDWIRAFRDAVRDLRAQNNNTPLIRLFIKDFDSNAFSSSGTIDELEQIILTSS